MTVRQRPGLTENAVLRLGLRRSASAATAMPAAAPLASRNVGEVLGVRRVAARLQLLLRLRRFVFGVVVLEIVLDRNAGRCGGLRRALGSVAVSAAAAPAAAPAAARAVAGFAFGATRFGRFGVTGFLIGRNARRGLAHAIARERLAGQFPDERSGERLARQRGQTAPAGRRAEGRGFGRAHGRCRLLVAPLAARVRSAQARARRAPIRVTAIERELGTRYTVHTLRALKRSYPKRRFIWLMGADNLAQLHLWRDWRGLAREMPIAVIARPGYDAKALASPAMAWLRRYRLSAACLKNRQEWSAPALIELRFDPDPRSATALRQADRDWVRHFTGPPPRDAVTHSLISDPAGSQAG